MRDRVGPPRIRRRLRVAAGIPSAVASLQPRFGRQRESSAGMGHIMAQRAKRSKQTGMFKTKPARVFADPQAFLGSIRIGIEHPRQSARGGHRRARVAPARMRVMTSVVERPRTKGMRTVRPAKARPTIWPAFQSAPFTKMSGRTAWIKRKGVSS